MLSVMMPFADEVPGLEQVGKAHVWAINGTFRAGIDEDIIQKAAEEASAKGSHNGDPEVVTSSGEDPTAVADRVGHHTRAKVSSQIDGVARFPLQSYISACPHLTD